MPGGKSIRIRAGAHPGAIAGSISAAGLGRRTIGCHAVGVEVPTSAGNDDLPQQKYFSGMEGKALNADQKQFPSMAEVLSKIPKHCFVKDTAKSLMYAAVSTALTVGCGVLAYL